MTQFKRILRTKAVLAIALGGFLLINAGVLAPRASANAEILYPGHLYFDPDGTVYVICGWTPADCVCPGPL